MADVLPLVRVAAVAAGIGVVLHVAAIPLAVWSGFRSRFEWKDDVPRLQLARSKARVFRIYVRNEWSFSWRTELRSMASTAGRSALAAVALYIFVVGLLEVVA